MDSIRGGYKKFDLSRASAADTIKITASLQKSERGELSGRSIERLSQAIGSLQVKTFLDKIVGFFSHISQTTREMYLSHRISAFKEALKNNPDAKRQFESSYKKIQLSLMGSKLELSLIPCDKEDKNYKTMEELYERKQDFMNTQMESVDLPSIKTLLNQSRDFPLMKEAMQKLADSYQSWDSLPPDQIEDLKMKIETQHKNLIVLSQMLEELGNKSESSLNALKEITLPASPDTGSHKYDKSGEMVKNDKTFGYKKKEIVTSSDNELGKNLRAYLDGEEDLTKGAESLKKELEDRIQEEEKFQKEAGLMISDRRPSSPITNDAIRLQELAFETVRKSKAWAAAQSKLTPLGTSSNPVFELKSLESKETIGFFKVGLDDEEEAAGKMETLMWDLAVIMGLEKQFAPTLTTKVQTGGGNETGKIWTKDGDLIEEKGLSKPTFGSIQAKIKGESVHDCFLADPESKITVAQEQVVKATITSLVFGMFDAHPDNILIDDKANIVFFDNTRSMPHSNGVIAWGSEDTLLPSYRAGLLALPGSYESLTDENREMMVKEIGRVSSKISQVEAFLNQGRTQGKIKELPPLWLNVEESLPAMKERIANMKSAIENPNIKNLRDFIFEVIPDYRFFAAMQMLTDSNDDKFNYVRESDKQRRFLSNIGFKKIDDLLLETSKLGVEPKKLRSWCQDPSLSFEDVLSLMWEASEKGLQGNRFNLKNRDKQAGLLYREYKQKAKIDLKDYPRSYCEMIKQEMLDQNTST